MKRILITGMSGTGKSTVIAELRSLGYRAIDMDEPGWSLYTPDGEWIWNEERVHALLASLEEDDTIFLSGCAINQGKFYPQIDTIILLSAPADTLVERITTRTNNPYGSHPDDVAATLDNLANVEPLLRKGAHHEIVTTAPLNEVVASVLRLVNEKTA